MSGKAILFIVAGIIMIAGIVFHRIEASSTHIVANSAGYLNRQSARNIAQSGVNLALRHLGDDSSWRTTGWSVPMMGGRATVTVFDTASFMGVTPAIGIRSTATFSDTVQMSSAFCYFPPAFTPSFIKGLLTLNAGNQMNGNIVLDARDHDTSGNIILTKVRMQSGPQDPHSVSADRQESVEPAVGLITRPRQPVLPIRVSSRSIRYSHPRDTPRPRIVSLVVQGKDILKGL